MRYMDFQSALETFAEAWVVAKTQTPLTADGQKETPISGILSLTPWSIDRKVKKSANAPAQGTNVFDSPGTGEKLNIRCSVSIATSGVPTIAGCGVTSEVSVPTDCPLSEVVKTALLGLGYSVTDTLCAQGSIHIENWKPVALENVAENGMATVKDVFGPVLGVSTLRIVIVRNLDEVCWNSDDVRVAVSQLLRVMPQSTLARVSPLTQPIISNLINKKYTLAKERCSEFGKWYKDFMQESQFRNAEGTGVRNTFHPTEELPLLKSWYSKCSAPNSDTLYRYAAQLNSNPMRSERPKITLDMLRHWWKNERQREKRFRGRGSSSCEADSKNSDQLLQRGKRKRHGGSGDTAACPGLGNREDIVAAVRDDSRGAATSAATSNSAVELESSSFLGVDDEELAFSSTAGSSGMCELRFKPDVHSPT